MPAQRTPTVEARMGLARRRGWARVRAMAACLLGVLVFALSAAGLVMIVFAGVARAYSFFAGDSITDSPTWTWAPGGAGALAVLAVIVSFAGALWHFWRGATRQALAEAGAVPLDGPQSAALRNVAEELSIGMGAPMPTLYITDDPAPNAMSLRSFRSRSLVLTSGCAALPRDEVEAICAHEFGHLFAADAQWVTAGMVALSRARRFGGLIFALGTGLLVLVGLIANYLEIVLWSTGVVALALLALGAMARTTLRRLELSVRQHADEIADVAAVRLARNPDALGDVCVRLAHDTRRVSPVGPRSELLWFETVEAVSGADLPAAHARASAELLRRARRAYAEAGVPEPAALRQAGVVS